MSEKRCSICSETKPVSEFTQCNARGVGFYSSCKPCKRNQQKKSRNKPKSTSSFDAGMMRNFLVKV